MTPSSLAEVPAPDRFHIKIAAAPVTWNNNDLEGWRPRVPYPALLDLIAEAGYTATEYDADFGRNATTLIEDASVRGLTFCGSYQWVDLLTEGDVIAEHPGLSETLALLADIDCRHLIISDSLRPHRVAIAGRVPTDGSASLGAESYARIATNARHVAALAARHDIRVHYHNHVGTWIESPAEVDTLLDNLDTSEVDLCFDTGHYAFGGGDPGRFVMEQADVISYVHLKDVNVRVVAEARNQGWSFLDALRHYVFADIGHGIVDIKAIMDRLMRDERTRWIVIEQDTCEHDATRTAAGNLQEVSRYLE